MKLEYKLASILAEVLAEVDVDEVFRMKGNLNSSRLRQLVRKAGNCTGENYEGYDTRWLLSHLLDRYRFLAAMIRYSRVRNSGIDEDDARDAVLDVKQLAEEIRQKAIELLTPKEEGR